MSPKILSRIWKDDDFWKLDPAGKVTFFWLLSNGETHHCGHLVLSKRQFAADTGMDLDKGLADLDKGLPRAFVQSGNHLWLRNFMRHQFSAPERGSKSRMFKCLVNAIASMPEALRVECLRDYPEFYAAVHSETANPSALTSPSQAPSNGTSPLQAPYKGPEQSRAEQSRAECVSSERGVGETEAPPIELPKGFPATLEQALAQAASSGVAPEVVEEVWHTAMAAGGRDRRDRPVRSWTHHVRGESLQPWRQKKPAGPNGAPSAATPRPKSLGAEIMDAENTRKRLVAQMSEHPCNELSTSYDPTSEEFPAWQAMQITLRSVEAILRSIPKDAPEDWQQRLRKEAFQRELSQHPGNPESSAYDEEFCTPARQAEFLALRKQAA